MLFETEFGNARELGASLAEGGCNFCIYAPDAEEVFVCLYDQSERLLAQIQLEHRTQSKWFGFIKHVTTEHLYGIRVRPKSNRRIHPDSSVEKLLIDPYAKALNRKLDWDSTLYKDDSCKMIPKAKIIPKINNNYRPLSLADQHRIIYETHVKGLTKLHPSVPEHLRGTYLGAAHPKVIQHLKELGVTSVQFLPLMAFMPEPFVVNKGLTNYWGYNPVCFFAPEPRYAYQDALTECIEMVKAYREANIEVILDVVFNHTAEGGVDGPVLNFKGLCESHTYLIECIDETDEVQYANYSGCGNTVQVSDTYVLSMIVDAMRYWVSEIGISGFRFDLASILGREPFEFKQSAKFFAIIQQDPILKQAVMIAEPWDIGPGGYQLGHFPSKFLEVNDKFRDVVRGFWRGDSGLKGDFATRLMGSKDIFKKGKRPMHASVSNVSYHDGFTLQDLVSYQHKHNYDNLEDNRDGHNHNLSANYGCEGITSDSKILNIREQQKRNLFATLILSQGTAHILGGDELSRTQLGNNNAYCQDNQINWYNWQLNIRQQSFLGFCQYVIRLRRQYPLLQQMNFADDKFDNQHNIHEVHWYRPDGSHKTDIDWLNNEPHCFALHVIGKHLMKHASVVQNWLFCFNSANKPIQFNLPILDNLAKPTHTQTKQLEASESSLSKHSDTNNDLHWECMLNTALPDLKSISTFVVTPTFDVPARSMCIFKK